MWLKACRIVLIQGDFRKDSKGDVCQTTMSLSFLTGRNFLSHLWKDFTIASWKYLLSDVVVQLIFNLQYYTVDSLLKLQLNHFEDYA